MKKIKLGFAPTRRSIFSAPDAVKYRGLTAQRLKELGVDFVDITDINEEGLLYDDKDVDKIVEKFKKEGVDGLMLPHCNFGTEYVCARLAKKLDVPVLLWGPLDERTGAKRCETARHTVRTVCNRKGAQKISDSIYISDKLQIKRSGFLNVESKNFLADVMS